MDYYTLDRDSNISNAARAWIDTTSSVEDNLDNLGYKIEEIEREYENQLQRQKVHISRGDRITGHRIYGRGRKVTIPKGCFRNQKGIKGMPITT